MLQETLLIAMRRLGKRRNQGRRGQPFGLPLYDFGRPALLRHMRQLVGEQAPTRCRRRRELVFTEDDVVSERIGVSLYRTGRFPSGGIGMDADTGQIIAKPRLEKAARLGIEQVSAGTYSLLYRWRGLTRWRIRSGSDNTFLSLERFGYVLFILASIACAVDDIGSTEMARDRLYATLRHPHDSIGNLIGFDFGGVVGLRNSYTALCLAIRAPAAAGTGDFAGHSGITHRRRRITRDGRWYSFRFPARLFLPCKNALSGERSAHSQ
jgi:hypothetical protein